MISEDSLSGNYYIYQNQEPHDQTQNECQNQKITPEEIAEPRVKILEIEQLFSLQINQTPKQPSPPKQSSFAAKVKPDTSSPLEQPNDYQNTENS